MCTLRVFHTDQVSIGADRFGRKPMLLFSCGGMSLAMATMTGYYWCFAAKEWVLVGKETWEWASFVAMTLYVLRRASGFCVCFGIVIFGLCALIWLESFRTSVTPKHAQCEGLGGELSVGVACCSAACV